MVGPSRGWWWVWCSCCWRFNKVAPLLPTREMSDQAEIATVESNSKDAEWVRDRTGVPRNERHFVQTRPSHIRWTSKTLDTRRKAVNTRATMAKSLPLLGEDGSIGRLHTHTKKIGRQTDCQFHAKRGVCSLSNSQQCHCLPS